MVPFESVTERADRVLVLASGPSAGELDLELIRRAHGLGVFVLCVNRALEWAPAVSALFTLDPDKRVRPLLRRAREGVVLYCAVPDDYGTPTARVRYHRKARIIPWVRYLRRIHGTGPKMSKRFLAEDPREIHTGNSAWGALGLAYHLHPSRVVLIGVDATQRDYAYLEGAPLTRLDHLPDLFVTSMQQLQSRGVAVRNGSPRSNVRCFPREVPDDAVRWLMEGLE